MARTLQIQTNFTSGELSPRLYAHVDIAKYKNGLKTATNCVVLPHGPVRRRNGFKYIAETKDSSKASRLIKFQFDQSNAYILEFGHNYIRFYTDGGQITSGGSPYEVTTTYTESELFEITYVQFGRILYLFHGSHAPAQLVWTSDASWALSNISFYPIATSEEGIKPATTLTPGATSGTGVNFTAGAGTIFSASDVGRQLHNLVGVGKAAITAYTSATVVVCTILENFPSTSAIASGNWKMDLSPIVSVTPNGSRVGSLITLTSAAAAFTGAEINAPNYYLINNGVVKAVAVPSTTTITGEVQKSLDAVTASTSWTSEVPIWSSTYGYPKVGALHQQRLWAGSTSNDPQRVWASESGIFDSMGAGSRDGDALDFDLSNKEVSKISWMANIRGQLAVGTTGSEITVSSGSNGPITSSSLIQETRGYNGSNLQQPIGLDDQVIYVQRSGKKVASFRYNFDIDNYISDDLMFLAEHMPGDQGIKELAYAQDPDRNIFAVLNDGDMLVCTYIRDQEVIAWTRWTTQGNFESCNTISTGPNDEVWVIVKRTINGSIKRYVEKLDQSTGEDNLDGFSDCYLTYSSPKTISSITKANPGVVTANSHGFSNGDYIKFIDIEGMTELNGRTFTVGGAAANTFNILDIDGANYNTTSFSTFTSGTVHKLVSTVSGLNHLNGMEVQIKADGAVHEDKTVSANAVTLDRRAYELTIGLSYNTTIETLPKEYNLGEGSQQGQKGRHVRPVLRFYKSALPTVNSEYIPSRAPTDLMDSKLGLLTGDAVYGHLTWKDGFSTGLTIETDKPLPTMLLGLFGSFDGGSQ